MEIETMTECIDSHQTLKNEQGITLLEVLVSIAIASIMLLFTMQQYLSTTKQSRDNQIRISTFLQAQAVVQNIGFDLRILGNGLPFEQSQFQIGDAGLSDPTVSLPILIDSIATNKILFRMNESGDVELLTQDFNPLFDTNIHLTDTSNIVVNDPIYLSNGVIGGEHGLYAVVSAVNHSSKFVTVGGIVTGAGATFDKGSMFEVVPIIEYSHDTITDEIVRNSGSGPVVVAENASLQFDYQDENGNSLTLPLVDTDIIDTLRAIEVTVVVESGKKMSDGNTYSSEVTQKFGLRNLSYWF